VNDIHKRGGTILGSSRGGHDTAKIVDCLQDRCINQVYIIGGDGTQKGASVIYEVINKCITDGIIFSWMENQYMTQRFGNLIPGSPSARPQMFCCWYSKDHRQRYCGTFFLLCPYIFIQYLFVRHVWLQCDVEFLAQVIDKSFGFDTAVEEAQRAINAAHVEAESAENGIGVVKLMGRNSGMLIYTNLQQQLEVMHVPTYSSAM
jgi:6-phosphofructokinase